MQVQEFKFYQENGEWIVLCRCGNKMAHIGWDWSGRTQYRRYKCLRCGATTLNHEEPRPKY